MGLVVLVALVPQMVQVVHFVQQVLLVQEVLLVQMGLEILYLQLVQTIQVDLEDQVALAEIQVVRLVLSDQERLSFLLDRLDLAVLMVQLVQVGL
jgi:hypothetical protein